MGDHARCRHPQNLRVTIATRIICPDSWTSRQNDASALLEKIALAITALARLRRQIQLAADQTWPWRTEGVKAIRKAFLLPPPTGR